MLMNSTFGVGKGKIQVSPAVRILQTRNRNAGSLVRIVRCKEAMSMHVRKIEIFLLAVFLLVCTGVQAQSAAMSEPAWKKLETATLRKLLQNGDLVSVNRSGSVEMATIGFLVGASSAEVFDIIVDYENYGKLMPEVTQVKVTPKGKNVIHVWFQVTAVDFGPLKITTDYTLKVTKHKPDKVTIEWVSGKVKDVSGYWELIPVDGGKKTIVVYGITSNLQSASPIAATALKNQPATETAINLSSAVMLAQAVRTKAEK